MTKIDIEKLTKEDLLALIQQKEKEMQMLEDRIAALERMRKAILPSKPHLPRNYFDHMIRE